MRLGNLRLAVSHTFLYKKMDEYGDNHLEKITSSVKEESDRLAKAKSDIPSTESTTNMLIYLRMESPIWKIIEVNILVSMKVN